MWQAFKHLWTRATNKQRSWLRHYACKPENRGTDWVIGFFNLPNPSSRTMALDSTQPLTEMRTRNIPAGKGRPVHKADKLTASCKPII
jgi:hypothetical protein